MQGLHRERRGLCTDDVQELQTCLLLVLSGVPGWWLSPDPLWQRALSKQTGPLQSVCYLAQNTGCWDLRWFRPAPAGCLTLPPPRHSHRPLLQVQVQQRGWRPIANLNDAIRTGAESRFKDGPSFLSLFTPLRSLPPTSFWALLIFWAEPAPALAASGSIALHERGMVEKRPYTLTWERGEGSRVRGSQTCLRTSMSVNVCETWFGDVEEVWATSGGLQSWVTVVLYFGGSLQTKKISKWRNAFLLYGQYHAGATLERTFTLSLCFVGLSYATKAFSPPTTTLDVALQIQSVALELHHACLVFTRFAHRTWFPCHVLDWGRERRLLSLSTQCTARPLDDVNVL